MTEAAIATTEDYDPEARDAGQLEAIQRAANAVAAADKEAAGLDAVRNMPGEAEFRRLEAIVDANLVSYIVAGEALSKICDHRLYRQDGFKNFDSYIRDRFGLTRAFAYRVISASEVAKLLPMGHSPANERAARELVGISPEHIKEIDAAIDIKTSTYAQIRRAVQQVVNAQEPDCPDPIREASVARLRRITRKEKALGYLLAAVGECSDGLVERIEIGEITVCAAIGILLPELIEKEDRWRAAEQK
jgi:hypothetical protein